MLITKIIHSPVFWLELSMLLFVFFLASMFSVFSLRKKWKMSAIQVEVFRRALCQSFYRLKREEHEEAAMIIDQAIHPPKWEGTGD